MKEVTLFFFEGRDGKSEAVSNHGDQDSGPVSSVITGCLHAGLVSVAWHFGRVVGLLGYRGGCHRGYSISVAVWPLT